jgi:hypothetical protein
MVWNDGDNLAVFRVVLAIGRLETSLDEVGSSQQWAEDGSRVQHFAVPGLLSIDALLVQYYPSLNDKRGVAHYRIETMGKSQPSGANCISTGFIGG